ncbi:MAG: histidine phosphatase family protein [Cyanobacteria bacterium P01_D01_bin.1]
MISNRSITLIRHGPPAVSLRQKVRGHRFRQFVECYDAARIERKARPPLSVQQAIARADQVFASHRPRATHTAELLGALSPPIVDPQFREVEFPVDFSRHFRFSALTWTIIALTLWRLGYGARCESFVKAKQRARLATDLLEAQTHVENVVLVAHGGINRLIAKELRHRGWRGPRLPRSRHWGCTTYCR